MDKFIGAGPTRDERQIMTVCGPIPIPASGVVDAHGHTWIEAVPSVELNFGLDKPELISAELCEFGQAGGIGIIDCQPGGCGRNALVQRNLMINSGIFIVAATGFHLAKYYPASASIWQMNEQQAHKYFFDELQTGMSETLNLEIPICAGFIKIACQDKLEKTPEALLCAAAAVSKELNCAIEVHTEKGAEMERIVDYFDKKGTDLHYLVLCHVDKRPDFHLHADLAMAGVMLEYDTFFRPKYNPEQNLWPLLETMVEQGFADRIALATDMAEPAMWRNYGGSPGLKALALDVRERLTSIGMQFADIEKLTGLNISRRLARHLADIKTNHE